MSFLLLVKIVDKKEFVWAFYFFIIFPLPLFWSCLYSVLYLIEPFNLYLFQKNKKYVFEL
jgi:hypothetical protein